MDNFISTLANVISTYLNEHGLYTIPYNGFRPYATSSTQLLDIFKYDPFSMIGNCENTILGKCTLYLKDDNLALDLLLGDENYNKVGYKRGSIKFGLYNEESLNQIFNTAQEAFNDALKEIEDYRIKEYGQDDIIS